MASVKDVEKLADDLEGLVQDMRNEVKSGSVDFERLMQIADEISEHADGAAQTFSSVNEALMSRLSDLGGASRKSSQSKSTASSSSGSSSS